MAGGLVDGWMDGWMDGSMDANLFPGLLVLFWKQTTLSLRFKFLKIRFFIS